jgi:hypothetical protein
MHFSHAETPERSRIAMKPCWLPDLVDEVHFRFGKGACVFTRLLSKQTAEHRCRKLASSAPPGRQRASEFPS